MSEFQIYLQLGFQHITDIKGYDHILFVVALCSVFSWKEWRTVAFLVTAFTIGHSITLALATLNIISYRSEIIEFLIPVTIFLTCFVNFFHKGEKAKASSKSQARYLLALCFGLIHGMGFSNYLRSLLGSEQSIITPLFAFNVGLEIGQLLIVLICLLICFAVVELFNVKKHDWNLILSGIVAGMAIMLIINADYFIELMK